MLDAEVKAKIFLAEALCVPREAASNPVLEQGVVGKIALTDNRPAGIAPKVAFRLGAIYIFSKYLLNTYGAQDTGPGTLMGTDRHTCVGGEGAKHTDHTPERTPKD